jgi:hypothetical protein
MKVYILIGYREEVTEILGAYSTRDKAEDILVGWEDDDDIYLYDYYHIKEEQVL